MIPDSKSSTVRALDRLNLRLSGETFEAIDAERQARPGNISRNTWITEAVAEKLARERANDVIEVKSLLSIAEFERDEVMDRYDRHGLLQQGRHKVR